MYTTASSTTKLIVPKYVASNLRNMEFHTRSPNKFNTSNTGNLWKNTSFLYIFVVELIVVARGKKKNMQKRRSSVEAEAS